MHEPVGVQPPHFIGYLLKENSREIRWGQKNRESGIEVLFFRLKFSSNLPIKVMTFHG